MESITRKNLVEKEGIELDFRKFRDGQSRLMKNTKKYIEKETRMESMYVIPFV